MLDPKKDPARRCMPVAEWPEADRAAWEAAIRRGDLLDGAGPAAHWRAGTRKKVESSYGRFLTFLDRNGLLDRGAEPSERLTLELLRVFVAELQGQVASVTVSQRLVDLAEAFRVMVPKTNTGFLRKIALRLKARARPTRDKRAKVVHPRDLLGLGLAIMDRAETANVSPLTRACRFRDGLIIALLATRSIRRANLVGIRIGVHIQRNGNRWQLIFPPEETKDRRLLAFDLPEHLYACLEGYLTTHRPVLLGKADHDSLWVSYLGRPMGQGSIYDRVRALTNEAFGTGINLHAFRDSQATWMAIEDPVHVRVIPALLGHADHRTGERYYNLADSLEASRVFQDAFETLRRDSVAECPRPRRRKGMR